MGMPVSVGDHRLVRWDRPSGLDLSDVLRDADETVGIDALEIREDERLGHRGGGLGR
jgi:hypothetical protein